MTKSFLKVAAVVFLLYSAVKADFELLRLDLQEAEIDSWEYTNLVLRLSALENQSRNADMLIQAEIKNAGEVGQGIIEIRLTPIGARLQAFNASEMELKKIKCRHWIEMNLVLFNENLQGLAGLRYDLLTDFKVLVSVDRPLDTLPYRWLSYKETVAEYRNGMITWGTQLGGESEKYNPYTYLVELQETSPSRGEGDDTSSWLVTRVLANNMVELDSKHGPFKLVLLGVGGALSERESAACKAYLTGEILNKDVNVEMNSYWMFDLFGNMLGFVYVNDVCINELLVENGLARSSRKYMYRYLEKFENLQLSAMQRKLGVWKNPDR